MGERIKEMFFDGSLVQKVQDKLPKLFYRAELESSRAGKVGMQVGSLRERILVALLIYYFGRENVETELPITKSEIDVSVFNNPISIKTLTGAVYNGVKIIWTVDAESARRFRLNYTPSCDMIFVRINWNNEGGLFYIPLEVQLEVFDKLGKTEYIKLPKEGTNPRGVEVTAKALRAFVDHENTLNIRINWKREVTKFDPFKRWLDLWEED